MQTVNEHATELALKASYYENKSCDALALLRLLTDWVDNDSIEIVFVRSSEHAPYTFTVDLKAGIASEILADLFLYYRAEYSKAIGLLSAIKKNSLI